jgi:CSLREA domain-containing protein
MLRNPASKLMWGERTTVLMVVLAVILALLMVGLLAPQARAVSTFTVNRTADTPDANLSNAACDVNPTASGKQCTLRAAIQEANDNNNPTETDLINFKIPDSVDPGVKTISPGSSLPTIIEPVIIDGYSQPGSSVNTRAKGTNAKLMIELDGSTPGAGGLGIRASNSVVKGLVINSFSGLGIDIVTEEDVDLLTNVRVEGNFIGTNPAGTSDLGNRIGMDLFATANSTVGGTSRASRNLISGNELAGVLIQGGGQVGLGSSDNNLVQGNLIGTQKDGVQPLGNGGDGVSLLDDADGNRILSNSIFSNGGLGIDLMGPGESPFTNLSTPNDAGDADSGSNRLQNFPVLSSAKTISGTTTIEGTLNSRPRELYTIQFFSNPSGDEGQTFIGQKIVSTDASGNASFSFSPTTAVAVGRQITATATRNATGDTSEFSAAQQVTAS